MIPTRRQTIIRAMTRTARISQDKAMVVFARAAEASATAEARCRSADRRLDLAFDYVRRMSQGGQELDLSLYRFAGQHASAATESAMQATAALHKAEQVRDSAAATVRLFALRLQGLQDLDRQETINSTQQQQSTALKAIDELVAERHRAKVKGR